MTDRRLRVCFFNRSYWPDTGATGQLLTELAEDLTADHGFDVTVVTGWPIDGSTEVPAVERRKGVTIVRARGTTLQPRRFAGRAANYVTYFGSAALAAARLPRQDAVVAMTDPPIIGLAALFRKRGAKFVFLCQDIFPEVAALLEDFRSDAVNAVLDRVNRFLVRRADRIVALGETMARRLVEGKGADARRITVIHNWADTESIAPAGKRNPFSEAHGLADKFVVLHAGNIGMGQDLDTAIDAAEQLRARQDLVLLFIGEGTRKAALEEHVRQRGLTNVRFLPFQPRESLRWTYATADVCLVSLRAGLAGYIVPSKLYAILAAGRPYIAAIDRDSEVAEITRRHDCGVVVPPGDSAALAAAIERLAGDSADRLARGRRARETAEQFSRRRQVAAHAAVLRTVIDQT